MEYETFAARFPLVRNLLEGVFHQDWRFDYDSLEELHEDVLDGRDEAARAQLADQLERFADDQDEAAVDRIFVGSYTGWSRNTMPECPRARGCSTWRAGSEEAPDASCAPRGLLRAGRVEVPAGPTSSGLDRHVPARGPG